MIKSGVNINQAGKDERTPLHIACHSGKIEIVRELISKGLADFNPIDNEKNTPLDEADKGNHGEITKLLLSKGAKYYSVQK